MISNIMPLALAAALGTLAGWRLRRHFIKHRWGGEPSPGIRFVATTDQVCALTFDDGPDPATTPLILDALKKHGAHASFFLVGAKVQQHPELVRRIQQEGHDVGNHTYSHARLSFCSEKKMWREVEGASQALRAALGAECRLFRPPYGRFMGEQQQLLEARTALQTIMWDVSPDDWTLTATEPLVSRVAAGVQPGSIILLHDVLKNTAHSMDALLLRLQQDGYRCLSVSQLLQCGRGSTSAR